MKVETKVAHKHRVFEGAFSGVDTKLETQSRDEFPAKPDCQTYVDGQKDSSIRPKSSAKVSYFDNADYPAKVRTG